MNESEFEMQAQAKLSQINALLDTLKIENDEQLIYALGQCLHEKLEALELPHEKKGEIVSGIISCLAEYHRDSLGLYNTYMKAILDRKVMTTH